MRKRRRNWYIIKEREGETQNDSRNGSGMERKKKDTRKRVRKAVWAQEGRISGRGPSIEWRWGIDRCCSMGTEDSGRGPSKDHKLISATEEAIYSLLAV
jgi:hypothetical protein